MDKTDETHRDEQTEYVAPTIVDYGDISQITASRTSSGATDVGFGTPGGPGSNIFS
jgi:hypothetical protein